MTPTIDLFWSFRSPYCYLLTPRLRQLVRDYDLKVRLRPVYPLAIRRPEFFATAPSQLVSYVLTDTARTASYLGSAVSMAVPDPIVQNLETREISPDQPYAYRLTHLGMAAEHLGGGLEFACEVARLIWSGEVNDWTRRTNLQGACARADLSLEGLEGSSVRQIPVAGSRACWRIKPIMTGRAIGAFPCACSKTNRSSVRIGSTPSCGA